LTDGHFGGEGGDRDCRPILIWMSASVHDGAWDLTLADRPLIEAKRWAKRLRFAVMLLFFQVRGRFPRPQRWWTHSAGGELGGDLNLAQLASGAGVLDDTYRAHLRACGYRL